MKTLAGAPLDSESARAFLQRGIAFFAKMFLFARLVRLRASHQIDRLMGTQLLTLQLVIIATFALIFLRVRKVQRSLFELRTLDAALAVLPAIPAMLAFESLSPRLRLELLLLLLVAHARPWP